MLSEVELHRHKSLTQQYSPKYRKSAGLAKESEIQNYESEYSHVNALIDRMDLILHDRMNAHEQELMKIMKIEVLKILEDLRKVLKVYNGMIRQKNLSQDLWETRNEVEYFKYEAVRLFEENNCLRKQIQNLKNEIENLSFQQICQHSALRNIAKKLAKQKAKSSERKRDFHSLQKNGLEKCKSNQSNPTNQSTLEQIKGSHQISLKFKNPAFKIGCSERFLRTPIKNQRLKLFKQKLSSFSKRTDRDVYLHKR